MVKELEGFISVAKITENAELLPAYSRARKRILAEPETNLLSKSIPHIVSPMGMPNNPVTFTPEQIAELNKKLSKMRHDINNHLSLIVAAAELMKFKPELKDRVLGTLSDQAPKIVTEIQAFSHEFEEFFGITKE